MQDRRGVTLSRLEGGGLCWERLPTELASYSHSTDVKPRKGVEQGDQSHLPAQGMSLSLSFLTYDTGLLIFPSLGCCEQSMRQWR